MYVQMVEFEFKADFLVEISSQATHSETTEIIIITAKSTHSLSHTHMHAHQHSSFRL